MFCFAIPQIFRACGALRNRKTHYFALKYTFFSRLRRIQKRENSFHPPRRPQFGFRNRKTVKVIVPAPPAGISVLKNCKNYRPKCAAGDFFSDFGFDKLQKSSSQARRRRNFFGFRLRKTAKVIDPGPQKLQKSSTQVPKNCKSHRSRSPKTAKVIDPGPQKLQKSSTQVPGR